MKATTLLKRDHAAVDGLFRDFERAKGLGEKYSLFERIRGELDVHMQLEEELVYPAFMKIDEVRDLVREGIQEHRMVKQLLTDIGRMDAADRAFVAKVKTLKDNVQHHVEEEEGEIFPKVEKTMFGKDLDELGRKLEDRKAQLLKKVPKKALAPA